MIETILIIGFFFWAIGKLFVWLFNSIIGILPNETAEKIRIWARFAIAIWIVITLLCAGFGS